MWLIEIKASVASRGFFYAFCDVLSLTKPNKAVALIVFAPIAVTFIKEVIKAPLEAFLSFAGTT